MPEIAPGTAALNLREEFPPVSTADWEAVIRKDLKGADYEKRLVWRSGEGVDARPYYRREDAEQLSAAEGAPGEFPFARGSGQAWLTEEEWRPAADAVRADQWHDAGATAVQEVAFALAAAVEQLAAGRRPEAIEFAFAAGSAYFIEIAKLRAARLVWAQAAQASGFALAECRMRIAVRTARRNKSVLDRYSNLLRATTEALSAALGGCDTLYVEPFGFDRHLALNVQRIIREEAHIDVPADPAGGAWYVEVLTDSVAREAWKLFQKIEADGGYARAVESGAIAAAIAQSRAAREKAVAGRRRTLVGVNNFPDLKEKTASFAAPEDAGWRMALPFERIRERTARHAAKTGRYPAVLLLRRGDPKMRMARANFALNFFGCAGFDMQDAADIEGAPDLIVLCSSDAEYPALAKDICPRATVPVIVAGNPKEAIAELEAAGVKGFIHVGSDAVRTLSEWQDRLGMEV
jgi:methylmalonyl-CoA mutase